MQGYFERPFFVPSARNQFEGLCLKEKSRQRKSPDLASVRNRGILRCMDEHIIIDPAICNGRPVIKGTRITVQTVLEFLGAGDEIADVLEEFPSLKREDVLACLRFSSQLMGNHFSLQKVA